MPDPKEVAPQCTGLAGACALANPAPGATACIEYYGSIGAQQGQSNCTSPSTWNAGMTCIQAVPDVQQTGTCQTIDGTASFVCLLAYSAPGTCFTCDTACAMGQAITCTSVP